MREPIAPRPERSLPTYGEIIDRIRRRQQVSGLTVKELCQQIGLQQSTFYAWRAKASSNPTCADGIVNLLRIDEHTHTW